MYLPDKRWLALCGFDAAAGDIKISWVDFDADKLAAKGSTGDARGTAAHERIKDGLSVTWKLAYCPLHNTDRFLRGMIAARLAIRTNHPMPYIPNTSDRF